MSELPCEPSVMYCPAFQAMEERLGHERQKRSEQEPRPDRRDDPQDHGKCGDRRQTECEPLALRIRHAYVDRSAAIAPRAGYEIPRGARSATASQPRSRNPSPRQCRH